MSCRALGSGVLALAMATGASGGALAAPDLAPSPPAEVMPQPEVVLTPEQAARHLPVRLVGVVTFHDPALYSRFIQDESAGIYFQEATNTVRLRMGQRVELEGETSAGEFAGSPPDKNSFRQKQRQPWANNPTKSRNVLVAKPI